MASTLLEPYSLASIAVRSFVLLVLTAGVAFALRRRSAAVLHGVWTVGQTSCLATPVVMLLSPSWSLPLIPPRGGGPATKPAVPIADEPATAATQANDPLGNERLNAYEPPPTAPPTAQLTAAISPATPQKGRLAARTPPGVVTSPVKWPSLGSVALSVWAAGLFTILLRLLQQTVAVQRKLNQASDLDNADWHDQRDVAAQLLGLRANVALKRHSGALSPMVVGLFRPVVLLPDDADAWSHERRKLVLLHELAHVKRYDILTQTLACLACALHWFNPVCWYGSIQMRKLREMACDDLVLVSGQPPTDYADVLLDVARRYRHRGSSTAVAMAHTTNVENRILAILDKARTRVSPTRRVLRVFLLSATALVLLIGSMRLQSRAEPPTGPEQPLGKNTQDTLSAAGGGETEIAKADDNFRTIEVRIADVEGEPLEGAKLYIGVWYIEGYQGEKVPKEYFADARGVVNLKLPHRLQILRLWSSRSGYVPQFVNFAEGKHEEGRLIPDEYEFRLQKGHQLSGRVVDQAGNPITNAKVQVRVQVDEPTWGAKPDAMISTWLTDSDFNNPAPVTDSDGRWSIDNAPAPPENDERDYEFQLQVTHPEFAGDTRWGELQRLQGINTRDLRSGGATLTLDRGIAVSGQITGPDERPVARGLVVWSDRPYLAEGVNETAIDRTGRYETKHLAPGKYPITVLAHGFAPWQQTIEVNHDLGDLNIKLEAGNPIRIEVVDQAGMPIPNAYLGIGEWRGTEAIYNVKHPNVPESGIPSRANGKGVYEWGWAPDDGVNYRISATGFASREVTLVAKSTPHIIKLAERRTVTGTVTDVATGKPIERFLTMPVIVFRPDFYHTRTTDASVGQAGQYELPLTGSGDPDDRYRVRFEAEGYRSLVSEESFGPLDGRATLDAALQPAPSRSGRVVDADGRPVENATVVEASPTDVPNTSNGNPDSHDARPIRTDMNGEFMLHATTEPVLVRAYHNLGFAEKSLAPEDQKIGQLTLQPWATVAGRLVQGGQPVANQSIYFYPLVNRGLTEARFQDSFYAEADANGYFQFDRIPPIGGTLKAHLGPWRDSPLTSSEAIPLELSPGEHQEILLGGNGATITGRVLATGRNNDELSKQWSLNYLVSRDRGVGYPREATPLSFDASGPLQPSWLRQPDFQSWVATRVNYFVKLSNEGQLAIHGVEPGEYDLVVQLYEEPAGCLVETIGEKVVPVTVTAEQAATGKLDIGDVEVQCRIGPRIGSDMRVFEFTDASGRVRRINDMQGQYILLHVWATWCAPCVTSLPTLGATVERYSDSPLTVVGLNLDEDVATAKAMAEAHQMNWAQNYLGSDSELMRQLAVSSVPAYYLIGPDGKLIGSTNQWETIERLLSTEIE